MGPVLLLAIYVFTIVSAGPHMEDSPPKESDAATCYEIVAYQPSRGILPMFDEKTRNFEIAGKNWVIQQRWDEIGVASVVWEAVS